MVNTGHFASRTTFSVTDPKAKCLHPVVPCVAMTTRSEPSSCAMRTISSAASPMPTTTWICKCLAERGSANRRISRSTAARKSRSSMSGATSRGEAGKTCTSHTSASKCAASSPAFASACREASLKSVGQRIFLKKNIMEPPFRGPKSMHARCSRTTAAYVTATSNGLLVGT